MLWLLPKYIFLFLFHSFVPSILVCPSFSVHFVIFIFSALAFASLTGVLVVIVMRILSDHVVVVVSYSANIHINISFLALKHIGSDTAIQTLHFLCSDLQTCVLMFAVLYRTFVVTYL